MSKFYHPIKKKYIDITNKQEQQVKELINQTPMRFWQAFDKIIKNKDLSDYE